MLSNGTVLVFPICKVALGTSSTVYVDDPTKIPGCEKNLDVQLGYQYYIGAPWFADQMKGTSYGSYILTSDFSIHA